jgi:hypothetical protein
MKEQNENLKYFLTILLFYASMVLVEVLTK